MKKHPIFAFIAPLLEETYGAEKAADIQTFAKQRFASLCAENQADIKAVKTHTEGKIFPCISFYEGLLQAGVEEKEAVSFLDTAYSRQAEKSAASIRSMLKFPGLYKLMPRIFKWVTKNQFGEKAGFEATFYDLGKHRVKFDMTKCLYCEVCRKYGYPQLVPCFCHTDDVTDGHMHPKLLWNRTKIMGDGADCCDFDLMVADDAKPL